jgi:hypothetical protein
VQEQDALWRTYRGVLPSKCPSFVTTEMSNTPRSWFGPLVDNKLGGCHLDPKNNRGENFFSGFCTRNFLGPGWVSRYTATPLVAALSPGLVHGHQTRQEIIWIAPNEKFQKLLRRLSTLMFLIRIQVFWGQLRAQRASACPNIHE